MSQGQPLDAADLQVFDSELKRIARLLGRTPGRIVYDAYRLPHAPCARAIMRRHDGSWAKVLADRGLTQATSAHIPADIRAKALRKQAR